MEETRHMWKSLAKRFSSTDSFVSLVLGIAIVIVIGMLTMNYFTAQRQGANDKKQAEDQKGELASLPATHTVSAGETLWSIAQRYYKSGYTWVEIQRSNNIQNANTIEVGQVLTIPNVPPIVPPGQIAAASTEVSTQRTYTVVRGDYLWKIAVAQYDNGYKWSEIANANKLENPNVIHAGNVLILP